MTSTGPGFTTTTCDFAFHRHGASDGVEGPGPQRHAVLGPAVVSGLLKPAPVSEETRGPRA